MKTQKKNRDLVLQDLQNFYDCSKNTAQARLKEIKKYFKIEHKKRITLLHLCLYEGLPESDMIELFGN